MKSLNDYFDQILVINMDKDTDRLAKVTKEFETLNSTFDRVPGVVYGGAISERDRIAGCYLSHITAMKMAIKECSLRPRKHITDYRILICEDDVEFHPDLLTDAPMIVQEDYDYLWFNGSNHSFVPEGESYICKSGQRRQTHCISMYGKIPEILHHFEAHFDALNIFSPDDIFTRFPCYDVIRLHATKKKYAIQSAAVSVITGRTRPASPRWRD